MTHRNNARPSTWGAQLRLLLHARAGRLLLGAGLASLASTAIGLGLVAYRRGAIAPIHDFVAAVSALDRTPLLLALVGALLVVVALVARSRGLLGIIGSIVGGLLIVGVTVPALIAGTPGWLAALPVAAAVVWVSIVLTYGLRAIGVAAAVAVCACLIVMTLVVDTLFSASGLGETVVAMAILAGAGGMIDVAVTQCSAVAEMAEGGIHSRELLRRALRVGRDHLTSMIHTLMTALLGGALPGIVAGVGHDILLQGIVLILGAIGLALVIPVATVLAWTLVTHAVPAALLREHGDD